MKARNAFDLPGIFRLIVRRAALWRERARQRTDLSELGDHALADIGLTRAEARGETARYFWEGADDQVAARTAQPHTSGYARFTAFSEKERASFG